MMPLVSYIALVVVLLGAVCISSGYILTKALHKAREAIKNRGKKEADA